MSGLWHQVPARYGVCLDPFGAPVWGAAALRKFGVLWHSKAKEVVHLHGELSRLTMVVTPFKSAPVNITSYFWWSSKEVLQCPGNSFGTHYGPSLVSEVEGLAPSVTPCRSSMQMRSLMSRQASQCVRTSATWTAISYQPSRVPMRLSWGSSSTW